MLSALVHHLCTQTKNKTTYPYAPDTASKHSCRFFLNREGGEKNPILGAMAAPHPLSKKSAHDRMNLNSDDVF